MGRLVLPCALRGQYDLFVQARQAGALKLEAQAKHPHQSWPLLNHTHRIAIRTHNRVRKRQLIVKWERRWVASGTLNGSLNKEITVKKREGST